jgi:Glycerophosphoryl diester phosphodiesterase
MAALVLVLLQVLSPGVLTPAAARAEAPVVAAHRGAAALNPENTMTAFEAVARDYPDLALEMDVQPLADGTLVVFHDDRIDRVSADGQTGAVADMTAAQWRKLRIRHPDGGEPAPAAFLRDVLDRFGGTDKLLLIELKNPSGRQKFIKTLRPYEDQVILQSFNNDNTRAFTKAGFRAIQLMGHPKPVIPGVYATGNQIAEVTPEAVADAKAVGAVAWLWGSDLQIDDIRSKSLDIRGIMVNDPSQ